MAKLDRYLFREFTQSFLATLIVLLVVSLGGVMADLLGNIAEGKIPASLLISQMGLQLLNYLPVILPLALMLGLLLAFARLYRDSEMPVLTSIGIGPRRMLKPLLMLVVPVVVLIGMLSLWLGPWADRTSERMIEHANRSLIVAGLDAGRFTMLPNGSVIYIGAISEDGTKLRRVFVQKQEEDRLDVVTSQGGEMFFEGQRDRYDQTADTVALFGQGTWHATERLGLTLGLRYSRVEKAVEATYVNTDGGKACAALLARGVTNATICLPWANPAFNNRQTSESLTDDGWSGLARVEYQLTPAVLTYASWSRGRKSAGYNLDRAQTGLVPDASNAFAPEVVDAAEIGAKASLLDRRLLVSVDAFHQTYEDFQLNTFLGTTFLVRSIPEVTAKGAEVEATARLEGLTLQGGLIYAQTEYGDAPVAGLPLLAGNRLSFAPLWSGSLAGSWPAWS